MEVAARFEQHSTEYTQRDKKLLTVVGPFNLNPLLVLHTELSCVLVPTVKSAEGSLLELSPLCLDPLDLLVSPWAPPLLLLLLLRLVSSGWGILLIAVPLLFSLLPSLDLPLLVEACFDLPSFGLLSGDFPCCCGLLAGWSGAIDGCAWMLGGLIRLRRAAMLVCTVPLLMTTSVSGSSSLCSLAKLTNTCKNEEALNQMNELCG